MKSYNKNSKLVIWFVFIIYCICMLYLLFFAEVYGRTGISEYRYNLKPFSEIKRFYYNYNSLGFISILNIVGNVVAFIPMGLFLPLISGKCRNFFSTFFVALVIDILIETSQLLVKVGSFDVDDIILNMTGVIIGYIWYALFSKRKKR